MTKAEFVERIAGQVRQQEGGRRRRRGGARRDRRRAQERRGDQLHRLRQVQRRRARPAPGRQPAHRRADHDPGRQGAEVLRRRRAEVRRSRAARDARTHRSPTGSRRSSQSAAARSASGSTPIRPALRAAASAAGVERRRARGRGGRRPLPRADRGGGAGLRRGQAPARLLRAARRAGLGGAGRGRRRRARGRACWWSPTASAATCRSAPPPTRRRWSARPRRPGARSTGWAPTRSPPTRCSARDALEPLVDGRARRRAPGVFVLVRTSNPGAADLHDLDDRRAARCTSASPRSSPSSARRLAGERGPQRRGRGGRRHRAAPPRRGCAS